MNCAICYSQDIGVALDMGEMALAGSFLKPDQFPAERFYPLRLGFCRSCYAFQVLDRLAPQQIFGEYFYRSSTSSTARAHFERYAAELVERFKPASVVEVGCNDGVMLKPLAERVEFSIGIDPNAQVPGARVERAYLTERLARAIGPVDLVVANNVFAHLDDIHEFTRAVRRLLKPAGVFAFECHYLGSILEGQYDGIYHEHVFYHSLLALERHFGAWGMQIFDVQPVELHGGSMRFFACKAGTHARTDAVHALQQRELHAGFHRPETYQALEGRMLEHRRGLFGLLSRLHRERRRIAAYGAAGRANTLLQWCGVGPFIDYVVDDCAAKHGFCTPGTHLEIRPPEALDRDPPDYVLVTAWSYLEEIAPKCRGLPLIVPLPEARIVHQERLAA